MREFFVIIAEQLERNMSKGERIDLWRAMESALKDFEKKNKNKSQEI